MGHLPAGAVPRQEDEDLPDRPYGRAALAVAAPRTRPSPDEKDDKAAADDVKIDLEGIQKRLYEVPVPAGNYTSLAVDDKALFWLSTPAGEKKATLQGRGRSTDDDVEVKDLTDDVKAFELSQDGKKLLVQKEDDLYVIDAVGVVRGGAGEEGRAAGRLDADGEPARGVAADVRRGVAAGARLLLRPQHARRGLAGGPQEVRAAGRARHQPGGAGRPDRRRWCPSCRRCTSSSAAATSARGAGRFPPSLARRGR